MSEKSAWKVTKLTEYLQKKEKRAAANDLMCKLGSNLGHRPQTHLTYRIQQSLYVTNGHCNTAPKRALGF